MDRNTRDAVFAAVEAYSPMLVKLFLDAAAGIAQITHMPADQVDAAYAAARAKGLSQNPDDLPDAD